MKRNFPHVTWTATLALVLCQTGCGNAGQPATQQSATQQATAQSAGQSSAKPAAKKNATGTVGQVDPKQHTLIVKPIAANQQIQFQSGTQKSKEKAVEDLLLLIDERTQITPAGPHKGAPDVAQKPQDLFGLLAVGQLVRVVYEEPVAVPAQVAAQTAAPQTQAVQQVPPKQAEPAAESKQPVPSKDDEPPVPTPVDELAAAAAPRPAAPVQKAPANQPKPLRAVRIEILASAAQHAMGVDSGAAQP